MAGRPARERFLGTTAMNGFVANLTHAPRRRLLRGVLLLACCILSVSFVGAVHTTPGTDGRPGEGTVVVPTVEADAEVALASYQPPTRHALVAPAPLTSPTELMHDADAGAPAVAAVSPAEARQVVASLTATVEKMLAAPSVPASVARAVRSPRVVWMEVTAYCACKKCCGPRAMGITASGKPVSYNGGKFVAADTRLLKFNTRLLIPGYADGQPVPVIDRGGAIKGHKLDVYFPTHHEARQWGRRRIPVTVLE